MRHLIRNLILSFMPDPILQIMKKWHYPKAVTRFHESDFDVVRLLLEADNSAIDIGANAGWYTKLFSELVGPEGVVYSIEPVPPTFDILANTIRKLNLGNVKYFNQAISNKPGTTTMVVPHFNGGGENFYQSQVIDTPTQNGMRTFEVETTTLDLLMQGKETTINFVKCDVEGHELQVLEGSEQFLRKSDAAWLIEISGNPDEKDSNATKVLELFYAHGYKPYFYKNGDLRGRLYGDKSVNYFMLKPFHINIVCQYMSRFQS